MASAKMVRVWRKAVSHLKTLWNTAINEEDCFILHLFQESEEQTETATFAYPTKASLLDYLMAHMPNPDNAPAAVCRAQFDTYLSQLKHWKEEE